MPLVGKVTVITGGARGLGRAMGFGLLAAGASVVLVDIDGDALDEAVGLAPGARDRILGLQGDVSREASVQSIIEKTVDRFGRLDILVNNAGVTVDQVRLNPREGGRRYWEVTREEFRQLMDINTVGVFLMTVAALPAMLERKWGRIINVTTSLDTMWRLFPYGGSKAANEANTVVLAKDLTGSGVTANVLVPGGPVDTRLTAGLVKGPDRARLIPAEVMVPPLLWLASDASDDYNGWRFIADKWDDKLPLRDAARRCGSPAAWQQLGLQARQVT